MNRDEVHTRFNPGIALSGLANTIWTLYLTRWALALPINHMLSIGARVLPLARLAIKGRPEAG